MLQQLSQAIKTGPHKQPALWLPLLFVAVTGGVLVLLLFAVLGYQLIFMQRAYPGVTIAGQNVGGMTREQMMSAITTLTQNRLNRQITIQIDDQQWTFTGQQLGMQVDVITTANHAFAIGRQNNFITDLLTQLALYSTPQNIEPVFRYDDGPTNQVLQQLSAAVDYPPENARLTIAPDGSVEVSLSQRGRRLHLGATQPLIEAAVLADEPQLVSAFTQQVLPAIETEDLAQVQQQARSLLGQPFTFRANDGRAWQIPAETLAGMVTVAENPAANGQPVISLQLNPNQLMPYFEQFEAEINRDPTDARLFFNEETNTLEVVEASVNGLKLDVPAASQLVKAAIAQGAHLVDLPVAQIPPQIDSNKLDSLGITGQVVEATSYFQGSSIGRMRNIELAASKFNGVIVPPGKIFSFNQHLGPITTEDGYDESLIIYGNRTTVGVGGGVCQVSTTVFRAALFGGFELVERWAHGYRVSWYETNSVPGLDATIYTPDVDFRFRNDTEHFLLIQTETNLDAGTVTFKFFGTPTNREVTVSDPVIQNIKKPEPALYEEVSTLAPGVVKQVDWAKEGMDVTVTRVVKQGDTIVHEDEIVSHYRPWRDVYQVGAATRQPAPLPPPIQ